MGNKNINRFKIWLGFDAFTKNEKEEIQIEEVKRMVDAYMANGFNYFDTAYVYEGSEEAMIEALVKHYLRDHFYHNVYNQEIRLIHIQEFH